jgi:transglutaminase-like putative cysteine protease
MKILTFALLYSTMTFATPTPQSVEVVQEFHPETSDLVQLWIPAPAEDVSFQKLISREVTGNATSIRFGKDSEYGASYIYVRWEKVKDPQLKIVTQMTVQDRSAPVPDASDMKVYLAPTAHVPTDGIVKETADKITKGIKDQDKQAKALYDWIVENTVRKSETRGCGVGDVKAMLASEIRGGKCVDINSVFVGMARAKGIPAREVFGLRVAPSVITKSFGKDGDISKAQHCRAEYYSKAKKGWVAVDPADIRKVILDENLALTDPKVKQLREKLFGFWEGTWVAFNWARDFKFSEADALPLNYFMYPQVLNGKIKPDGMDPIEAGYSFKSALLTTVK